MKRKILFLAGFVVLLMPLAGRADIIKIDRSLNIPKVVFGEKDNNASRVILKGKVFRIELPANPTTGYEWNIEQLDQKYFYVISSGFNPPPADGTGEQMLGAGGIAWWEIKPSRRGSSTMKILSFRAWEGKAKTDKTFLLNFKIK